MDKKIFILLFFLFLGLFRPDFGFAQTGFCDEFDSPQLAPSWQVWTWDGEPWSYHVPSSYSLTEHPGYLRYRLGAMVNSANVPDLYQYWYYPSLHLWREFRGSNWLLEFKVTFFLPYSNAKQFTLEIFYGDLFERKAAIALTKNIDQVYSRPPFNFEINVFRGNEHQCIRVERDESLRNERYQTYYFRIIRLNTDFVIEWSKTGKDFRIEKIVTLDEEINSLPQRVQICSTGWFAPSGAYADFDYIRVLPLKQKYRTGSKSALVNFLHSPSLFLQTIGKSDFEFLEKFDNYFPILAAFEQGDKKYSEKKQTQNRPEKSLADSLQQELVRYQALEKETEKTLPQIFLDFNRANFLSSRKWVYDHLIEICAQLNSLQPRKKYDRLAFSYAEKIKSQCILQLLKNQDAQKNFDMKYPLAEKEAAVIKQLSDLCNKYANCKDSIDKKFKIWSRMHGLYVQWGKIRNSKQHLSFEAQHMRAIEVVSSRQIQNEITDQKSAILSYYFSSDKLYLFLLTKSDLRLIALQNGRKISRYVKFYSDLISQYSAFDNYEQTSRNVFSQLVAPVFSEIKEMKNLIIIPDSVLFSFPFESLIIRTNGENNQNKFLGIEYNISYAGSASALLALIKRLQNDRKKMTLDFFALNSFPENEFKGDKGSAIKSNWSVFHRIAELFPPQKRKIFLGKTATEDELKNDDGINAHIFHLAAHCNFDADSPWSPRFFLQPSASPAEDGILELAEVFNLKLKTEVAVLAGCRTGRGRLYNGEGMFNFSRAFLSAGAASVIVSLWDVEDYSTALFMKYFYEHLLAGASKAQALRLARRDLSRYDNGKYSHPFFWSPFVLIGDFR